MKLLDEIVDLLSSNMGSLNDALLKTKVVLHKIGQKQLVGWVNDEIAGYKDDEQLPEYRNIKARVLGNVVSIRSRHKNYPIPLMHVDIEIRVYLENQRINYSLGVLEKMSNDDGALNFDIPPEMYGMLSKSIIGSGHHVERAWCQIESSQIKQIIIEVRSRLLDFILALQEKIGDSMSDIDAKMATASFDINKMFNGSIFGNNATIVVGNNNNQQLSNILLKGDFSALKAELEKNGVNQNDISALDKAIKMDVGTSEIKQKKYGPAVKAWLQTMMGKAINASWNIELGIAGGLLTNALSNYYGHFLS